jgi:hypothetical protein
MVPGALNSSATDCLETGQKGYVLKAGVHIDGNAFVMTIRSQTRFRVSRAEN